MPSPQLPAAGLRLAAAGLVLLTSCARSAEPPVARNLILISLDTLRADRLGTYGYGAPTSPALDAFAARGLVLERAHSESSWTLPAHVTMLSGRTPRSHGVELPSQRIADGTPLLAEHLTAAGFQTFGSTDGVLVTESRGFARGFQHFDDRDKGLAVALHEARRFIERAAPEGRFFAFVHTYDIHCPYEPGELQARAFVSDGAEPFDARGLCGNPTLNAMSLGEGQLRYLSDLYDASIREADGHLDTFLSWLEESGYLAETLVVITSDHGEAFGEHGQIGHERSLHRELLHVPLILVGPGLTPGSRLTDLVGLVDLVPTVMQRLGLEALQGVEGGSFAPLRGEPAIPRGARLAHHARLRWQLDLDSLIAEERHLIVSRDPPRSELYLWDSDPAEAHDVAAQTPEGVARLLELLERERTRGGPPPPAPHMRPEDLTPDQLERLRALGYVSAEE